MQVHQVLATLGYGDAIGNEVLGIRDALRGAGHASDIFVETADPRLEALTRDYRELGDVSSPDTILVHHFSIGSRASRIAFALPDRMVLVYHNITPPEYFSLVNPRTAGDLARGRDQVRRLAGAAAVNMADSRFNADEIAALGYRDVRVLPLMLDLQKLRGEPDRGILRQFGDGRINILFVGRVAPNKKVEDLLRAFHFFRRFVEPEARFIHVGSFAGTERYYYLLLTQARELGIDCVHFAGSVPQAQLNAFYRVAHVFLCMSEHEGFCIPVLEAMVNGVPVVAHAAAAVPETMDGAGVLFEGKPFEAVAEMMGRLVRDVPFREAVVRGQNERIARMETRDLEAELRTHLAPLLERPR